jgi:membrane associated rhomboid family serine protease
MNALGLNGTRLLWRWNRRRRSLGEAGMRAEIMLRSTRGRHKMCRSCRALVTRSASVCPECGTELRSVSTPGPGRLLSQFFPGISTMTMLLLLVNGFWFLMLLLAQMRTGGAGSGGLFGGFPGELLVQFGSGVTELTFSYGEWWRIVTPIFLHSGLLHFFFNSYVLLQLGPVAEAELGTERTWVIYLASGICGAAASQIVRPVNTVGASGAIFGLMGLLLAYGWRRGGVGGGSVRQLILSYALYSIIFSLAFRIDHVNHFGGFACGALFGLLVSGRRPGRSVARIWQGLALSGVLLVLYSFFRVARQLASMAAPP